MPYNWKGDALAKMMIVFLILAVFLNSGIIIGFQLMSDYSLESSQDAIHGYSDYNLIDSRVTDRMCAYLLAAPAKENRLVLTEKHFIANRHRLLLDEEVGRNAAVEVKADLGTVLCRLDGSSEIGNFTFRAVSLPIRISYVTLRIPLSFLLWNLALLTVELLAWYLIHKIRNG